MVDVVPTGIVKKNILVVLTTIIGGWKEIAFLLTAGKMVIRENINT